MIVPFSNLIPRILWSRGLHILSSATKPHLLRETIQSWTTWMYHVCVVKIQHLQCESKKSPPLRGPDISHFSHKRLRIFNRFFTHLLYVPIYARPQIFIQLSPTLMKLCHTKRDYPVHIICAKCPKCAKTRAFRRLRKSLIDLLIIVCGK